MGEFAMVNVRPQPGEQQPGAGERFAPRFNVLLTESRPQPSEEHWSVQLLRLLRPQGVQAHLAHTGREAVALADRFQFHAVVVDVGTPVDRTAVSTVTAPPGGLWLLDLFQRMPNRPPVVLITSPMYSQRQLQRLLTESLRLGAFCVLNKPIELEQLLAVFRKLLDRTYRGAWPGADVESTTMKHNPPSKT